MKRGMTVKENAENHYRRGLLNDKSNKGALTVKCSFTLSTYRIHFEGVGIFVFVLGDQIYIFTLFSLL